MQFVPENGVYVYFRYNDEETVMIVMNQNESPQKLDLGRFAERLAGFSSAQDVMSGENIEHLEEMNLPPNSAKVLQLIR